MVWTVIVVLIVLWALGLIGNVGGGFIHLLLVLALIAFIYNMVMSRRHPV
jgi:hypothetical protein